MLKTEFWQKAADKLPAGVRERHLGDMQRAERVEILLDGVIGAVAAVKAGFARALAPRAPRTQH